MSTPRTVFAPSLMAAMDKIPEPHPTSIQERGKRKDSPSFVFPLSCIDVGCGSGILSIAAIKLGSKTVLGVDIDIESVRNSRENADVNEVGEELILGQGSVTEVLAGQFAFKSAPLVVANILAPVLIRLFDAGLADLVEPNGEIILSGILDHQAESVIEAGQVKGLKRGEVRQMKDWVAISMKK